PPTLVSAPPPVRPARFTTHAGERRDHLTTTGRKCKHAIACLGRRAVVETFEQPHPAVSRFHQKGRRLSHFHHPRHRGGVTHPFFYGFPTGAYAAAGPCKLATAAWVFRRGRG